MFKSCKAPVRSTKSSLSPFLPEGYGESWKHSLLTLVSGILIHLPPFFLQKTEWLCLNCQTKRLLEGSLGEPAPMPLPTSQQPPAGVPHRAAGAAPPKQKGPQGLGQPPGSLPAKASPQAAKASPQAKPLRASEPSKTSSSAQEKKTGIPVKAEPVPKPPPETTVPPGTPKAKSGVKRTEPAIPVIKPVLEAPKGGEAEVSSIQFPGILAFRQFEEGLTSLKGSGCNLEINLFGTAETPQLKEGLD